MRTIFGLISLLCIIISGLLIINIPFLGLFKVFSLFPDWVYIVLFLGIVIPYLSKEDETDKPIKRVNEQIVTPQATTEEKIGTSNADVKQPVIAALKEDVHQHLCKGDTQIDYSTYEYFRWQENKQPISKFSPVKIAAVNDSIINPYDIETAYDMCQMPYEYRDSRPYGEIKIEQTVYIKKWKHSEFVKEKRYSTIIAPISELEERVNKNGWVNDSILPGAITIRELLSRVWIEEQERKECFGFTSNGKFFEVHEAMGYSEDINIGDIYLTKEMAQKMVEDILNDNPDNLPF
jgi:hypothetical protein